MVWPWISEVEMSNFSGMLCCCHWPRTLGWTRTGQVALPWNHPPRPTHCTLLERGPYAGPRMDALRFFFFSWQMAAKTYPISVWHTAFFSEKMAPVSTLWKACYELVVVLDTHTCPGRSQGQHFYQAWEGWPPSLGLLLLSFLLLLWWHMGTCSLLQETKQCRWRGDRVPFDCTHTQSPGPQG